MPDSRRLPRAAAIHDHNRCVLESRVRVRADGVRKVMIDKPHLRARWPELLRESLPPAFLMPHAQEVQRGIQSVQVRQRHFPGGVTFQIVPEDGPRRLPTETHLVQLLRSHFREVQAHSTGVFSKAGIVLQAADALLCHGKQQVAVAHNARRRIMHLRIVNPKCQHSSSIASRKLLILCHNSNRCAWYGPRLWSSAKIALDWSYLIC